MIRWILLVLMFFMAGSLSAQRTWQTVGSGVMSNLNAVTYGNGLWVAVGDNGVITTSSDGLLWTPRGSGTSENLLAIAYGAGRFVATRANQTSPCLTSADGMNWSTAVLLDANGQPTSTLAYNGIAFGGGRFLAAGSNLQSVIVSTDGQTFRSQSAVLNDPAINAAAAIRSLIYHQGTFVACSEDCAILGNFDGAQWTLLFNGYSSLGFVAVAGNGIGALLAVGPTQFRYYKSSFSPIQPDLTETGGNPKVRTPSSLRAASFSAVCRARDGFVAVDSAGAVLALGRDFWRTRANFGGGGVGFRSIAFDGSSRFVAVGTATQIASAIIAVASVDSVQPPTYRIERIGPLPGTPPLASWAAYAINNAGQVTGGVSPAPLQSHAFVFANGVLTDLGYNGRGTAINDFGRVVGNVGAYSTGVANVFPGRQNPFVVADPTGNFLGSLAFGINNSGIMVGGYTGPDGNSHAYYLDLSNGAMTDLGTLGGTTSFATSINSRGDIAGTFWFPGPNNNGDYPRGFLYTNGALTTLPSLGGFSTYSYGINNQGAVTGSSATFERPYSYSPTSAFVFQTGTMTNIDNIGASTSTGIAINNRGEIVGQFLPTELYNLHNQKAFLYTNGDMYSLADLLDVSGAGWQLESAMGINDSGKIVGYGTRGGELHSSAFIATPTSQSPLTTTTLINISTRMRVGTGEGVGIAGFAIRGGSKKVIVRAIGPDLLNRGIANALLNPYLQLYDAHGVVLAENDDWKSAQQAEIVATGFPPAVDAESAIVATLPEGNYTAIIRGVGQTTGVALIEVYDLDVNGNGRLVNISTRASVGTGEDVVIAGFVTAGSRPKPLVIRAIGPDLVNLGVAAPLPNPSFEIYDGGGNQLEHNDDWQSAFYPQYVVAAGLAPNHPLDSAIYTSFLSGAYTVIVHGVGNTSGVSLVEVYEMP